MATKVSAMLDDAADTVQAAVGVARSVSHAEVAPVLAAFGRMAVGLAILGGSFTSMFSGARVQYRRGDDATLLFSDPANGVAVIALWSDPLTPTRVPLKEVSVVLTTLAADVAPVVSSALVACAPALSALISAGVVNHHELRPALLPTVVQAALADVQARALLALSTMVRSKAAPASLSRLLAPLAPLLCQHAVEHPVRLRASRPDVSSEASGLPVSVADLSSLSAALLESVYSGPRLVPAPANVVEGLVPSEASSRRKKNKSEVDNLPTEACFALGDSVTASSPGAPQGVGIITGPAPSWAAAAGSVVVDPHLQVRFGSDLVVVLPESALSLVTAAPTVAAAGTPGSAPAVDAIMEVSDGESTEKSAFNLGVAMAQGRSRLFGFAVGTLRVLSSTLCKELVWQLVAASAVPSGGNAVPLQLSGSSEVFVATQVAKLLQVCMHAETLCRAAKWGGYWPQCTRRLAVCHARCDG